MKQTWLILLAAVALLAIGNHPAAAQDAYTNQVPNLMPPATNSPLNDLKQAARDGYSALSSLSFTNGFNAEPFMIYHKGDYGFGLSVSTANTNGINLGFFLAAVNETGANGVKSLDFYDGGVALSANGTYNAPLIGLVNLGVETGAAVDLSNPTAGVYNQSIADARKAIYDNGNISIAIGGGIGYLTKWNGSFEIAFLSFTDRLKGKHFMGLW